MWAKGSACIQCTARAGRCRRDRRTREIFFSTLRGTGTRVTCVHEADGPSAHRGVGVPDALAGEHAGEKVAVNLADFHPAVVLGRLATLVSEENGPCSSLKQSFLLAALKAAISPREMTSCRRSRGFLTLFSATDRSRRLTIPGSRAGPLCRDRGPCTSACAGSTTPPGSRPRPRR